MRIEIVSQEIIRENLLSPYIQIFDDSYHDIDEERGENEESISVLQDVRRIRRRYTDMVELHQAKLLYETYITNLINKYGGFDKFQIAYALGHVKDYIPPQPRMKQTKFNRLLEKHDIIVSAKIKVSNEFHDTLKEKLDNMEILPDKYFEKDRDKMSKVEVNKVIKSKKYRGLRRLKKAKSIDYIERYFMEKEARKKETRKPTLSDYFFDNVVFKSDKPDKNEVIYYKGSWMPRKDAEAFDFYNQLEDYGWDGYKIMRESLSGNKKYESKRITSLYKKERKKKKKDAKRKKNKKSDFIISVGKSINNDYETFADFEDDVLDFTSENIFGK